MLTCMAPPNLSDDVALCSQAVSGIFRLLVGRGMLKAPDITPVAAAAGLSEAEAAAFGRGETVLPPHQSLVLMVSVFDRLRARELAALEQRTAQAAPPVTAESVQQSARALEKKFPGWTVTVDEMDTIPEFGPSRLLWHAKAADKALYGPYWRQTAKTEPELAGRISAAVADLKAEQDRMRRYTQG